MRLLIFLLLLCATPSFAQLKGRVLEINSKNDTTAVIGVVLFWKNTQIASTTNENGQFSIITSSATNQLIVKALGYNTDTISVSDTSKFITLILKSGIELSEVQIIYETSGTEFSYLNPIKIETLGERSLMKAAC